MRVVKLGDNDPVKRITALIYGAMRSGKTRLAGSFPRPIFLSDATESGWTTLRNMDPDVLFEPGRRPDVWAIEKATDMYQAINQIENELKQDPNKWMTVVVDSLTFYGDLYFNQIFTAAAQGNRTPDLRQLYGALANHLRDLRIRIHSLPLNVVWLCLEKSPGEENPFGGPMLSGQASQKFSAGVDYLWYARCFQNNPQQGPQWEVRTKQFGPYKAGGRDEGLLPDPLPENTYRDIASLLGLPTTIEEMIGKPKGNGQPVQKPPQQPGPTRTARP